MADPTIGLPAFTLRPMTEDDVDDAAAIEAVSSRDGWSRELFAGEFTVSAAGRHWLVAAEGDTIVGFGGIMLSADEAHLMNLAVAPEHRRRGLGSGLVVALMEHACDVGAVAMTLEVRSSNQPAIALYRELGFTVEGTRTGYYPDGEDAHIMWLRNLPRHLLTVVEEADLS